MPRDRTTERLEHEVRTTQGIDLDEPFADAKDISPDDVEGVADGPVGELPDGDRQTEDRDAILPDVPSELIEETPTRENETAKDVEI